jgi:anaerobic magnesium-protoporphyrin IX monomethyl ester cyclase
MNRRILLINPPGSSEKLYGAIFKYVSNFSPPLGLAYLAAVLIERGHHVSIRDYSLTASSIKEIVDDILADKPDFIGITSTTSQYNIVKKIIDSVKRSNSLINIVMGGSHFTALPLKTFQDIRGLDYGIVGEGEYSFCGLVEGEPPRDIEGLVFRDRENIFYKNDFAIVEDLNKLPYPARHLLPLDRYIPSPVNYMKFPSTTMITSRGCLGKCDFCVDGSRNHGVRFLSADKVFGEMLIIKEKYGVKDITIKDDGFTQDKKRVISICDLIIKRGLKIHWNCLSRVGDVLDKEMLKMMKSAGCYQIAIGIETFNKKILESHSKLIKEEAVIKSVELLRAVKIESRLFFIIGFPEETREDIINTFNFAKRLKPDIFQMCILVPFPGTRLRERYEKDYSFRDENWDFYLGFCPEYAPTVTPFIPKKELVRLFYQGYRGFFLNPKNIMKNSVKTLGNLGLKMGIKDIIKKAQFIYYINQASQ